MLDHEETRPLNKAPEAQSRLHKLRAKYSSNTKGAQQQPPSARRGNDMSSSKSTSNLTSSMVTPSNETSALSNKNPSFVQPAERISKRRPSQQAMTTLSKPKTATKANARTPAKGVNSSAYSTGTYPYFMKSSPASENPLSSAHSQKSSENMSTSCSVKDKPANYASFRFNPKEFMTRFVSEEELLRKRLNTSIDHVTFKNVSVRPSMC